MPIETKAVKKQVKPIYDLEERTFIFAKEVRSFVKKLPKTIGNIEDLKQLIRSSGSVGANYLEADDNLGKRDEMHKIKISRKEARESRYWLQLIDTGGEEKVEVERLRLAQEAKELMLIFSSITRKLERISAIM